MHHLFLDALASLAFNAILTILLSECHCYEDLKNDFQWNILGKPKRIDMKWVWCIQMYTNLMYTNVYKFEALLTTLLRILMVHYVPNKNLILVVCLNTDNLWVCLWPTFSIAEHTTVKRCWRQTDKSGTVASLVTSKCINILRTLSQKQENSLSIYAICHH